MENTKFNYKSEFSNPEFTKQLESSESKKKLESDFYKNAKIQENSSDLNETSGSEITEQNSIESAKKELESDFYNNNNLENSFDTLEIPETDISETQITENIRDTLESDFYKNRDSLTDMQKSEIKNETGWTDKIVDSISIIEQYEKVYKPANLKEKTIDGRSCAVRNDIDPNYKNEKTGETNKERMEKGKNPFDSNTGEKIELHHMQQKADSPFAHLLESSEHRKFTNILHEKGKDSFRRNEDLKNKYNLEERPNHWKEFGKEQLKNG